MQQHSNGGEKMKKIFRRFILQYGKQICALAVAVSSIAPNCCRGHWYQPEEPEGLAKFFEEHKK